MDLKDKKKLLAKQMIGYLGSKEKFMEFVEECKIVGLHLGDEEVIDNIAKHPQLFAVIISHSQLGLLRHLGGAIKALKNNTK